MKNQVVYVMVAKKNTNLTSLLKFVTVLNFPENSWKAVIRPFIQRISLLISCSVIHASAGVKRRGNKGPWT